MNNTNKHYGIINSSMNTGLQMNLKDAIEDAGAIIPENTCLWEYPEIIRKNLINKTVNAINLIGSDIINVNKDDSNNFIISTKLNSNELIRPNYSFPGEYSDNCSADEVFKDLFKNILPAVRGLHAADMTTTDNHGEDESKWYNSLFNIYGVKTDLKPNSKYLRIYLTCQAEPIYVYIDAIVNNITGNYNVIDSDTIKFELNHSDKILTAHISCIDKEQIDKLN